MGNRLDLQTLLESLIDHVYFQPPENVSISYPCIIYRRSDIRSEHADNIPYSNRKVYSITVIEHDPDSVIPDQIAGLSTARLERFFTADGLNHNVFTLYF